uniref:Predicted protein n=1 Tax=Hordeum vulgare subsp. vulgare TaxID=112509 RepID=F2D0Q4_HORVV|nr:predicted protein [Hordeum vulgare subsp. vulgare]
MFEDYFSVNLLGAKEKNHVGRGDNRCERTHDHESVN